MLKFKIVSQKHPFLFVDYGENQKWLAQMDLSMFNDRIWLDKLKITLASWRRNVLEAPNPNYSTGLHS